jgi:hypothetical protein
LKTLGIFVPAWIFGTIEGQFGTTESPFGTTQMPSGTTQNAFGTARFILLALNYY